MRAPPVVVKQEDVNFLRIRNGANVLKPTPMIRRVKMNVIYRPIDVMTQADSKIDMLETISIGIWGSIVEYI
jgi:hypothetical protein